MTSWAVIARSRQATKQSRAPPPGGVAKRRGRCRARQPADHDQKDVMTQDQVKAVLERVPTWPEDRQRELAEIALEIEAELTGTGYDATPDELAAIDEGLAGGTAS